MCIAFVRGAWKLFSLLYLQPCLYFFYFSKKSYKNVCSGCNQKKKKKKTQIFERAIVQLATSNLDFDISFNQIQ